MQDVFILSARRTAIGSFGGSLAKFRPAELATIVMKDAIAAAGVSPSAIGQVAVGNVIPSQPADAYISRAASVNAGVSIDCPAMNVNRLCGSGLQAIVSMAQAIRLGECDLAIGAGSESMSNAPHMTSAARFGTKLGDIQLVDGLLGALHDPFDGIHMGETAENIAERKSISRKDQDALALESHRRAANAIEQGHFVDQIVPVAIRTRRGERFFTQDEHVRTDVTSEGLAALHPVFREGGSVTAGNASGLNDGAAALVLAGGDAVTRDGLEPMARIVSWGHAGVQPDMMGLGPVKAVPIALERAGLNLSAIDIIESNEAFAAQACGVARELGFDPARTNPNGSGISLGHPVGATGAIITVKAIHELHRTGGRFALITMCIGGGQGIAMIIERQQ